MAGRSFAGWCAACLLLIAGVVVAQQPAYQSKPVTATATIEAIDKANRVVRLKGAGGNSVD